MGPQDQHNPAQTLHNPEASAYWSRLLLPLWPDVQAKEYVPHAPSHPVQPRGPQQPTANLEPSLPALQRICQLSQPIGAYGSHAMQYSSLSPLRRLPVASQWLRAAYNSIVELTCIARAGDG